MHLNLLLYIFQKRTLTQADQLAKSNKDLKKKTIT